VVFIVLGLASASVPDQAGTQSSAQRTTQTQPALGSAREYYNRGRTHNENKKYELAIEDFTTAIRLDPNFAEAYNTRVWTYAYYLKKDFNRAISDANQALKLNPNNASYLDTRGWAYLGNGDYDRAIADFEMALKINSNLQMSIYGTAKAQQAQAKAQEALAEERQKQEKASYFTGDSGKNISLGIGTPKSQGLSADQAYLPTLVQGVLVDSISKYSEMQVLDRVSLDRVIAETLDPTFADNMDIVRLGHVAQVGNWLTGNIIRTSSGFTLQLNITDTTLNAVTVASYTGTSTVAEFDNHSAIHKAALALLEGMGVVLTDKGKTELVRASSQQYVQAQTAYRRALWHNAKVPK
jgi:tetratricopeptide (TPR) repeat protein